MTMVVFWKRLSLRKSLVAFLIFLGMFSLQSCMKQIDLPPAKSGVLDLRHYSFSDNEFYPLSGQWEFYWNKQYFPKDFENNKLLANKTFVEVPATWSKLKSAKNSRKGFATYRLKILLPKGDEHLAIRYGGLTTAGNIYVNGTLLNSAGKFSTAQVNSAPDTYADFFEFSAPKDGVADLLIQVSSYEQYWSSGLTEIIYIGSRKAITTKNTQLYSFEVFLIGAFLIIAFYHLMLFIYNKDDLPMLLFALLSFDVGLRIFTGGEVLIAHVFPFVPYQIYVRIEYISWYLGSPLFLHFVISLFEYTRYRLFVRINYLIGFAFTIFALLVPTFVFTQTKVVFQVIFLMQMLSSFYFLAKAYRDEKYGIRLFLVASILMLLSLIHDILNSNGSIKTGVYLAPLGMSLFFYAQIAILAYRFYDSFRKSVLLSDELQTKNMELMHINSLKDEFLLKTSDELKAPLKGILGMVDSVLSGDNSGNISSIDKQHLALIYSSSTQMLQQINDSLDFSKLNNQNLELQITPVDLSKIIFLSSSVWNANKVGEIQLNNAVVQRYFVYADEQRLQQSLYNLIYITEYYGDGKIINIAAEPKGDVLYITISSSSLSIKTENFEHSLDEGPNENLRNSLFNLSISKKLIELQKGKLTLLKENEEKTIGFQIALPLAKEILQVHKAQTNESFSPMELVKNFEDNLRLQDEILKGSLFFQTEDYEFSALIISSDNLTDSIVENYLHTLKIRSTFTQTGEQGLKALELDSSFDVIIIENSLPDMSGYELSKLIREKHKLSELPILMVTSSNQMDEVLDVFENGANDYITKPFAKNEFLVRINLLISYKVAMLEREKISTMEKELSLAKKIQTSLLPKAVPEINFISFGTLYLPMAMVGGDYYDVKKVSDTSFALLVADVSGHGIPAALIASMLKISFQHNEKLLPKPAKLLAALNNDLYNNLDNNFLTAVYAYFDLRKKSVTIVCAGHPPVLIKSQNNEEVIEVKPKGLIVGLDKDTVYEEKKIELKPGDRLLFYSDGITEVNSAGSEGLDEKEEYGDASFKNFIQLAAALGTREFVSLLVENLFDYSGLDSFNDDLTMVVVDYNP